MKLAACQCTHGFGVNCNLQEESMLIDTSLSKELPEIVTGPQFNYFPQYFQASADGRKICVQAYVANSFVDAVRSS